MRQRAVILTGQDGTKYAYGPFRNPARAEAYAQQLREYYGKSQCEIEDLLLEEPVMPT